MVPGAPPPSLAGVLAQSTKALRTKVQESRARAPGLLQEELQGQSALLANWRYRRDNLNAAISLGRVEQMREMGVVESELYVMLADQDLMKLRGMSRWMGREARYHEAIATNARVDPGTSDHHHSRLMAKELHALRSELEAALKPVDVQLTLPSAGDALMPEAAQDLTRTVESFVTQETVPRRQVVYDVLRIYPGTRSADVLFDWAGAARTRVDQLMSATKHDYNSGQSFESARELARVLSEVETALERSGFQIEAAGK